MNFGAFFAGVLAGGFIAGLAGCAGEGAICSQEPQETVLSAAKPEKDILVAKIYHSGRVMIRYRGRLATAAVGKEFRYADGKSADGITLEKVDADIGEVTVSGYELAFVMRDVRTGRAEAATYVRPGQ